LSKRLRPVALEIDGVGQCKPTAIVEDAWRNQVLDPGLRPLLDPGVDAPSSLLRFPGEIHRGELCTVAVAGDRQEIGVEVIASLAPEPIGQAQAVLPLGPGVIQAPLDGRESLVALLLLGPPVNDLA